MKWLGGEQDLRTKEDARKTANPRYAALVCSLHFLFEENLVLLIK